MNGCATLEVRGQKGAIKSKKSCWLFKTSRNEDIIYRGEMLQVWISSHVLSSYFSVFLSRSSTLLFQRHILREGRQSLCEIVSLECKGRASEKIEKNDSVDGARDTFGMKGGSSLFAPQQIASSTPLPELIFILCLNSLLSLWSWRRDFSRGEIEYRFIAMSRGASSEKLNCVHLSIEMLTMDVSSSSIIKRYSIDVPFPFPTLFNSGNSRLREKISFHEGDI